MKAEFVDRKLVAHAPACLNRFGRELPDAQQLVLVPRRETVTTRRDRERGPARASNTRERLRETSPKTSEVDWLDSVKR